MSVEQGGGRLRGVPSPDLEPDVERIHRPISREPSDPDEGREPPPWWVWTATVLAIFWGGFYLGRFGGDFQLGIHEAFPSAEQEVVREVREARQLQEMDPVAHGQQVYENLCQACHQPDGNGLPGAFPPLVGSTWVTGSEDTLVRILLGGLSGPIEVAGSTYNGAMPGWREQLSDQDLAAVATFVRQWRENGAPPVEPATVARLRAQSADRAAPWTAPELRERETASAGSAP